MKTFGKVMKVLTTIAAIIGVVYVIATYGDKIVAWANDLLDRFLDKRTCFFDIDEQMEADVPAAEEAAPVVDTEAEPA